MRADTRSKQPYNMLVSRVLHPLHSCTKRGNLGFRRCKIGPSPYTGFTPCRADEGDDAFGHRRGDLQFRQPEDAPTGQRGFEILLGVLGETLWAIVPTLNPDAALDLDERPAFDMGEVRAPATGRVKGELTFKFGATEGLPIE